LRGKDGIEVTVGKGETDCQSSIRGREYAAIKRTDLAECRATVPRLQSVDRSLLWMLCFRSVVEPVLFALLSAQSQPLVFRSLHRARVGRIGTPT
jgi:hypothetical protein